MKIKKKKNIGVHIWCPFLEGEPGTVKKKKEKKMLRQKTKTLFGSMREFLGWIL